jgi:hypothetical protein
MRRLAPLWLLSLSACSVLGDLGLASQPIPVPVLENGTKVAVPQPAPIKTSPVHWQVLDSEGLKALVAKLESHPDSQFVIYALDTRNFEALTLNLSELKRYIEQQKEALKFAVDVLDRSDSVNKNSDNPQRSTP